MKDSSQKKIVLTRRAFFLGGIKAIAIAGLLSRFYYLQVGQQEQYRTLSDKNRIRTVIIPPIRGIITDCKGVEIVNNNIVYCIIMKHESTAQTAEIIGQIEKILEYQTDISRLGVEKTVKNANYNKLPIIIQNSLTWRDITLIESNAWHLQNKVEIVPLQKRSYLKSKLFGHITGYVSRPSVQEAQNIQIPNYREFEIGKSGVEKTFENVLQGKPGIRTYEADARNTLVRELSIVPPTQGRRLALSIDNDIQKMIAEVMADQMGTVALANIEDCTMAGLYSSPSYDPNEFIGGIKSLAWHKLLYDPDKPLINKAISSAYPPGSIFKIATALAILGQGISPEATVFCNGEFTLGNRIYHCWNSAGHGTVNWHDATSKSCNVYFYTYGLKIGIKPMAKMAHLLGLGQKTNIELPSEQAGIVPDHEWKRSKLKQIWYAGDTVNASIGQGFILTTPIQLLTMILRIIHGKAVRPSIIKAGQDFSGLIQNWDGQGEKDGGRLLEYAEDLTIQNRYLEMIRYNLYRVFNSPGGTGYTSRLDGIDMAGKTGTAQVISQRKTQNKAHLEHGWFAGFAPYDQPKYAIWSHTSFSHAMDKPKAKSN